MKYEKSCGAIIFRKQGDEDQLLLIQHRKGRHWGFPKGHVERDETERETALREVREETGLYIHLLEGFRQEIQYAPKPGVLKTVVYFLATPRSHDVVSDSPEVEAHAWVPVPEALTRLSFENQRSLLGQAWEYLAHIEQEKTHD